MKTHSKIFCLEKKVWADKTAQSAIEYLLLLTLVAIIVIASFSNLLPKVKESSGVYFLKAAASIMGNPLDSLPGVWCEWGECIDGGQKRLCDCPAPIGSGAICAGPAEQVCTGGWVSDDIDADDDGANTD